MQFGIRHQAMYCRDNQEACVAGVLVSRTCSAKGEFTSLTNSNNST